MITPAELALVERLGACWDDFLALPVMHDDDLREFRTLIHAAQEKVLARPALRTLDDSLAGSSERPLRNRSGAS